MTTVDSFKSSIVSFNNQWLLVETTTTKQKLATPTKGISLNNATTNLEISSSINCISQDKMEIYHNVVLNGWLIQTVSVFKPQNPVAATQQQTATSSTSQSQLNMSQQTKISSNNKQASQVESPKSTSLGSGDEEIEEEDIEDDEVIDENNQYDPEAEDDSDDGQNVEEEISAEQQIASNDQLLYKFIDQLPKKVNEIKPVNSDNCNNKAKSPKQFNSEISAFSSRSTTNNSESNYSVSKISKSLINQIVPAFSCDNIIEDQDKKKRIKKNSILTDDSQNETRQNFETEESLMNSHCGSSTKNSNGDMLIEDQISCSAIPEKDTKVSVNNVKNNSFIAITRNSSPSKEASQGEGEQGNKHSKIQLNNNIINQNSPLRNASSSLETAVMMQLNNNGHDSNNDMLQNSSCSQNEDSSNFSIETDKIYNQLLGRKRNILKKAIAKSSNNIDKSLCNISSTNLQNPSTSSGTKPRKSSYLNSIKLASSPSLTNLNYKRDRKNLVKNFIKAFRGFINNASDEPEVLAILKEALSSETTELIQELNSIRKNFEKFISKKNYNNTLMVELIQNQEFNVLFSYFLKEKAQEWIYSSKIKDKLSHEEALNHYLLSLKDSKALAKVRCLKYRSATNIEDAQISPMNSKQGTGEQFEGFN